MTERNPDREESRDPLDEEAIWAEIVASYGEEPADDPDRPESESERGVEDLDLDKAIDLEKDSEPAKGGLDQVDRELDRLDRDLDQLDKDLDQVDKGLGKSVLRPDDGSLSFTVYAAGTGPRDWDAAEPSDDDLDESDDGHFVPPDPPLPKADTTAKFAWLAVLGGPLLLVLMTVLQQELTWWAGLLGIGGFIGGFATLVIRMRPGGDEDDELPGGGAVV
ncbi:hypothetical protein G5C51_33575 [Streptomyces sp. A7024]|uniref:DUF308 domain-containing protein n=1 Tax=Streptomyces coryli TaxID=1128680 RepID=A0A6G4UAR9_9ACTN|nr:hypothetical protein [Streptomyces coryli]